MLIAASILITLVALMHSVLGGRRLINPITRMDGLPVILGSLGLSRLTLQIGWHMLSLTWIGMAGGLLMMHFQPRHFSSLYLLTLSMIFGASGIIALLASRGKHLSWLMFIPTSAITAFAAFSN